MESLYILIPIAIMLVCVAVGVFIWAVKSEQFEDLERQGMNILLDDDEKLPPEAKTKTETTERSEEK
ncbi:cbb3-type cytochrome oxidase assembly protein CcoS [Enterovibrio sp. 27052020O]|uniref:cbb3-type cytochrome oxidase assembly protein CcoS n=1 Tax=Enterovibrio sp. 27052020O TaxID=3241166 RepID=UPI00388F4F25